MKYEIRAEDWTIIEAAIRMGDWLAAYPGVSDEQVRTIRRVQAALRKLPDSTADVNAGYGFSAEPIEDHTEGVHRSWMVTIYSGVLEIFSIYVIRPSGDVWEAMGHELDFEIKAGRPNLMGGTFYFNEWVEEVSNPSAFQGSGINFEVIVEPEQTQK